MKSFLPRFVLASVAVVALAACNSSSGGNALDSAAKPSIDPNSANQDASKLFGESYTSKRGPVFEIKFKYETETRAYGVNVKRVDDQAFDKSDASFDLVQSLVREYFYAKVCSDGYHPGVLYNDYKAISDSGDAWSAKLKCFSQPQQISDKV